MKKFLGFMAIAMAVVLLPMGAKAISFEPSCTKSCPTANGKCTSTCTVKVSGNTTALSSVQAQLNFASSDGITVKNITPGDGWTKIAPAGSEVEVNGTPVSISFASSGVSTSDFTLVTFTLELESADVDCSLSLNVNGVEYKYEEETEIKTENPSTGASLPIALVGVGAVGAVIIYSVTKKNKKMYKI